MHQPKRNRNVSRLVLLVAVVGALAVFPAGAPAATVAYHPDPAARNFDAGVGNWTATTTQGGVGCVVSCATSTAYRATGGTADSGYLQSTVAGLASLVNTAGTSWLSPVFTYDGIGGRLPDSLVFRMDRSATVASLLGVGTATQTVSVVAADGITPVATVVEAAGIGNNPEWHRISAALDSSALTVGSDYRIRIDADFANVLQVVADNSIGYDNVVLAATGTALPAPAAAITAARLRKRTLAGIGRTVLKGRKIRTKIRCAKAVAPARCTLKVAVGLKRKGGKATATKTFRRKGGKTATVRLAVKKKRLARTATRRKVWVRVAVKVPGVRRVKVARKVTLR